MTRALPLLLLLLAGCSEFPDVGRAEAALTTPGTTPALLTASQLAAIDTAAPRPSGALAEQAAALRARANQLRRR